jgi:hypothetical protein
MAPPRTFDYELLKRLLREHPDWSMYQYAKALSEDNWTRDPRAPAVSHNAVATAISKNRWPWGYEGVPVNDRRVPVYDELIPREWKPAEGKRMHVHLRKLRTLARLRRGQEAGTDPKGERQALQFEKKLKDTRQVVDMSSRGVPYLRGAEAWEDDVVASPRPGDWPEERIS